MAFLLHFGSNLFWFDFFLGLHPSEEYVSFLHKEQTEPLFGEEIEIDDNGAHLAYLFRCGLLGRRLLVAARLVIFGFPFELENDPVEEIKTALSKQLQRKRLEDFSGFVAELGQANEAAIGSIENRNITYVRSNIVYHHFNGKGVIAGIVKLKVGELRLLLNWQLLVDCGCLFDVVPIEVHFGPWADHHTWLIVEFVVDLGAAWDHFSKLIEGQIWVEVFNNHIHVFHLSDGADHP